MPFGRDQGHHGDRRPSTHRRGDRARNRAGSRRASPRHPGRIVARHGGRAVADLAGQPGGALRAGDRRAKSPGGERP